MAIIGNFEYVGRFLFPKKQVKEFSKVLASAGYEMSSGAFLGYLAFAILGLTILLSLTYFAFPAIYNGLYAFIYKIIPISKFVMGVIFPIISFLICYFGVFLIVSGILNLQSDIRRNALENALPDFLMLVSANIKAGMSIDQAMWYSAKPEFGLLAIEVKNGIKSAFSGEPLESALDKLASRFDSKVFTRTIILLKQAFATGGEISKVLEETSQDLRNTSIVKKEVGASLILYEIFVLFASVLGTPFLFAVSSRLISVFELQRNALPTTSSSFGPFGSVAIPTNVITANDFYYFSLATIFITSLFSSLIISTIRSGSRNEGIKYFPFIMLGSYIVYAVVGILLSSFFASIL